MKKPFHIICTCILAAFILVTAGIFIGRNIQNNTLFLSGLSEPLPSVSSQQDTRGLVDINSASVNQLQQVPGIGPVLAQRIIDYRDQNGPFAHVAELTNVDGIGSQTLQSIFEYITAGGNYEDSGS